MSIFSKISRIFNKDKSNEISDKPNNVTKEQYQQYFNISSMLILATSLSYDTIKSLIKASSIQERIDREKLIFLELIYFYLHMTMRTASLYLNNSEIEKLQNCIKPKICDTTINACFNNCPIDLRPKLIEEFYNKLNNAEQEYARVYNEPFKLSLNIDTKETDQEKYRNLFYTLSEKLAKLSGNEKDMTFMLIVMSETINTWPTKDMNKFFSNLQSETIF